MNIIFEKDFNLENYNAYRIKAICAIAWFPKTEMELCAIYKNSSTPKIIIGNGNNIILSREYYKEEFIILNGCLDKIENYETIILAEAGATLENLCEVALQNSLSGLENFYDIPSSVGGGIVMNAGTKDGEIKDILVKVSFLNTSNMEIGSILKEDMNFSYRNSIFQNEKDKIILKGWFQLKPGNNFEIKNKMQLIKKNRWEKQPREFPNCGSVFKRPSGKFVGPMIDELSLKGFSIGGAKVSEKHSGFIINTGEASGKDILALISEIQRKVKEKFNIELEVEQRII